MPPEALETGELGLYGHTVRTGPVDQVEAERKNRLGGGFGRL